MAAMPGKAVLALPYAMSIRIHLLRHQFTGRNNGRMQARTSIAA
jgi:hypothetical protein